MKKKKFHEAVSRSVAKSITFRVIVLLSDAFIMFTITHRYDLTFGIVILSNVASSCIYFVHERYWNTVHWGKRVK